MSMNETAATQREPQVTQKATMISKRIEELFQVIESLEKRFDRVERSDVSSPQTGKAEVKPVLVSLAEELDSYAWKLNDAIQRISSLYERCEL
jgi:hypothetical protein